MDGALDQMAKQESVVKKQLMMGVIVGSLLMGTAAGAGAGDLNKQIAQREWQGAGVGGVLGGIVGGPPGIIIGLAGGALFGRGEALEDAVQQAQVETKQYQESLAELKFAQRQLENQIERYREIRANRLQAMVDGFSLNIHFRTKSAMLEQRYQQQLDRLADSLRAFPELNIHIDAFADVRGQSGFNHQLTEQRALVVQRQLAARGINGARIHRVPHGEAAADYLPQDPEGMGFDRRVLLYFTLGDV
jgi:outer membrane protein OmpA-like peptidoglycan-associated protein